jgi:hypothetical protein
MLLGGENRPMPEPGATSVAAVSAAIAELLKRALELVPGAAVRLGPPRPHEPGEVEARLWLYRVTPNQSRQNIAPRQGRPQSALLDLHYAIWLAADEELAIEMMLARLVGALEAAPILTAAMLAEAARERGLPHAEAADHTLQLVPEPLSLSDLAALGALLGGAPLGLSIHYVVLGVPVPARPALL